MKEGKKNEIEKDRERQADRHASNQTGGEADRQTNRPTTEEYNYKYIIYLIDTPNCNFTLKEVL